MAAAKNRLIEVLDVKGAYLNAEMDSDLYLKLNKSITEQLQILDSRRKQFIHANGSLMVRLKCALYGCKQSGCLWWEHLTIFLTSLVFKPNEKDNCVENIQHANKQMTLCRQVDVILTISEFQLSLATQMETKYKEFNDKEVMISNIWVCICSVNRTAQ